MTGELDALINGPLRGHRKLAQPAAPGLRGMPADEKVLRACGSEETAEGRLYVGAGSGSIGRSEYAESVTFSAGSSAGVACSAVRSENSAADTAENVGSSWTGEGGMLRS